MTATTSSTVNRGTESTAEDMLRVEMGVKVGAIGAERVAKRKRVDSNMDSKDVVHGQRTKRADIHLSWDYMG